MRLNRFLASAGIASRRGAEEVIRAGRVTINGKICTELGTVVEPKDSVMVDGRLLRAERPLYAVLYKPRGILCTASDEKERGTIFDLLPKNWPRVFHVGRLDKESEGLLLMTNDGDLSLRLTHPRYKMSKEYEVALNRQFDMQLRPKLLEGFHIEGGRAKMDDLRKINARRLQVLLRQGLKRQIRLMFYELGYEVTELIRTRIGPIEIAMMKPGDWRFLTSREVAALSEPEPTPATAPAVARGVKLDAKPENRPPAPPREKEPRPARPLASRPAAPPGGDRSRRQSPRRPR